MDYLKPVGVVKHPSVPYRCGCMSTHLAVGDSIGVCRVVSMQFHGTVLGQPVSYLALLAYCATDFSLESHGSKPFPPTLLKTCVFLPQLVVGRVRLRKTAFRHWLIPLRVMACLTRISQRLFGLWAGAMQVSGVDFGGCGVWTEQQLWSKGTSSGTADLQ